MWKIYQKYTCIMCYLNCKSGFDKIDVHIHIVVTLISRKVSVLLGTYILYSIFNHICYWVDHTGDHIDPSVLLKKKDSRCGFFFSFAVEAKCTCFAVSFIIFPNGNRLLYSYIYI